MLKTKYHSLFLSPLNGFKQEGIKVEPFMKRNLSSSIREISVQEYCYLIFFEETERDGNIDFSNQPVS